MEMANVMMTKVHMTTGPQMCVTTCCNMKNSRCERGEERRPFLPSPLYHAVSTFLHYRSNALFPSHSFRQAMCALARLACMKVPSAAASEDHITWLNCGPPPPD